jgi:hypothetical protein
LIGVFSKENEAPIIEEFFQLFKTPWEFYQSNHLYDVVISTRNENTEWNAKLVLVYGSEPGAFDSEKDLLVGLQYKNSILSWNDVEFPVYGNTLTFDGKFKPIIGIKSSPKIAGIEFDGAGTKLVRIGYNLFEEVSFLLSSGQPLEFANIPTLEIHISILRRLILDAAIPFVEIPPVPQGYPFMVCLTHDVDFVGIRKHKLDHTMGGFLYRASIGSFLSFLKGGYSLSRLIRNWKAILSLPGIYLGLCKDFWLEFDRCLAIEKDLKSTFFFIPFKNLVGEKVSRRNSQRRAARYDITDVEGWAKELTAQGYEIGVHAIDAWHNYEKGVQERRRISEVTGKTNLGVRTHWLCFDKNSAGILDEAGFCYDSTFGYNELPGYRAGTTQVFRFFNSKNLLELPLHIQDKSLLDSRSPRLTEEQAWRVCVDFFDQASLYGGALTILWHMRSLSPERCWDNFYVQLLAEVKKRGAWIGNARQVVEWFRRRRMISFGDVFFTGNKLRLNLNLEADKADPNFVARVYIPGLQVQSSHKHVDIPLSHGKSIEISL